MNNTITEEFPIEVCKEVKNYVYRLIDPRNGDTFYVGRGKNNRIFEHIKCALKDKIQDDLDLKFHKTSWRGFEALNVREVSVLV